MFQQLLLLLIVVTSGVGVVALARRFSSDKPSSRNWATAAGVALWGTLWLLAYIEPRLDWDRAAAQGCIGGSELDETLRDPVVIVRTPFGGDYVAVETSGTDKIRVTRQRDGSYATVDLRTGKASAMSGTPQIMLCNGRTP